MKNWKQILAPVLVFVLGAMCGGGVTALYAMHKIRAVTQAAPGEFSQMGARALVRRLNLDTAQREAAQPILNDLAREVGRIRVGSMPEVRAAINDAAERLRPILRPPQQRKLDEMLSRPRARWERLAPPRPRPPAPAAQP